MSLSGEPIFQTRWQKEQWDTYNQGQNCTDGGKDSNRAGFEADFQPCSYGFRPKRSAKQAMDKIYEVADKGGALWVIDADIKLFRQHKP